MMTCPKCQEEIGSMSMHYCPLIAESHAKQKPLSPSDATACCASLVLRLTLKKQWFDMIASGVKMEEYRDPSPWIYSRLLQKDGYTHRRYDVIEFKNGYGPNVPTMTVKFEGWKHGLGIPKWGANPGIRYVVIKLGRVLSLHNATSDGSPPSRPQIKQERNGDSLH